MAPAMSASCPFRLSAPAPGASGGCPANMAYSRRMRRSECHWYRVGTTTPPSSCSVPSVRGHPFSGLKLAPVSRLQAFTASTKMGAWEYRAVSGLAAAPSAGGPPCCWCSRAAPHPTQVRRLMCHAMASAPICTSRWLPSLSGKSVARPASCSVLEVSRMRKGVGIGTVEPRPGSKCSKSTPSVRRMRKQNTQGSRTVPQRADPISAGARGVRPAKMHSTFWPHDVSGGIFSNVATHMSEPTMQKDMSRRQYFCA
mmetsp:Transcript_15016/g.45345  ORF Transcript_15016/g.45345 Transcript_15016/m.45345 type:complete len:255 (+) Transcript_15016:576-1340(+)